ncbi:ATP-binding protein [Mesorhizobium sp. M0184]|uniref:HD domain-containing protein n=1 Tax=Mesorhizobium sp. M0184 TaxID=2956906 RepID=UPI00333E05B5
MNISVATLEGMLPNELMNLVKNDSSYITHSINSANRFTDWFRQSGIPFFKGYTDHSEKHSLEVFGAAIDFVGPLAYKIISVEDISVLMTSCYCHDCGMHITESQFLTLIDPGHTQRYNEIDSTNWPDQWRDFFQEAKRFNQDTLLGIFGDTEYIPDMPKTVIDFTDRHRLLVGEFLRRNHPRLAHDIAVGLDKKLGLPTLLEGFNERIRDLIGFIARSHGESLRSNFDYIEKEYNLRDFNRIHIIFLMGLLRLADYAQIQATRAPQLKAKIHTIGSPISQREWRVHQSIINITRTHDDPEAILVEGRPSRVTDYLRVKEWLVDLQGEMDRTWAVFGEVYGRQTTSGLSELQLSIRRVRSNILEKFSSELFVPERIAFKVSEPEMLSLLLAPLYGDHPGYGIRELVQNARDAVLEAKAVEAPHLKSAPGRVDIFIEKDGDLAKVRITDNGIGMSLDVITNYFLNAGASYRSSYAWQNVHLDDSGRSLVARSGRFGVGALAAFLIGPQISVQTKHWASSTDEGLSFSCKLHDKEIQVEKIRCNFGTEVEIEANVDVFDKIVKLLEDIKGYYQFGENVIVDFHVLEIDEDDVVISGNRRETAATIGTFNTRKFISVSWGRAKSLVDAVNFVNGIAISPISDRHQAGGLDSLYESQPLFNQLSFDHIYYNNEANMARSFRYWLSIEDRDAFSPLNLSRTKFNAVDEEITSHINGRLFSYFSEYVDKNQKQISKMMELKMDEGPLLYISRGCFIYRGNRFLPFDVDLAKRAGIRRFFDVGAMYNSGENLNEKFPNECFTIRQRPDKSPTALSWTLRQRTGLLKGGYTYMAMLVEKNVADGLRNHSTATRWMNNLMDRSEILDRNGTATRLVEFGTRQDEDYNLYRKLLELSKSETIEMACSSNSDYYSNQFRRQRSAGVFVDAWEAEQGLF